MDVQIIPNQKNIEEIWNGLNLNAREVSQEQALRVLFLKTYPHNTQLADVIIKVKW